MIASARGTIFECEFREARLVVARDRLREKHAAAVERVAKEAREREHAAISAERDAVSERLLETYARAAGEIAEVLAEAVQSTRRVAAWNAQAAGPWIAEPPQLQRGVRLPARARWRGGILAAAGEARRCRDGAGGAAASARRPLPRRRGRRRRSRPGSRRRTVSREERAAGCWRGHGDNDTAALRAAAQALVDVDRGRRDAAVAV